ncbi:MAG: hypothetical protein MSG64_18905 [Pyrinomonadaceae bacterium MAG19_C2-C3]|nr:hypothetical protein [Pyrinomonadaceae bacterium MAG19_C2-C3]
MAGKPQTKTLFRVPESNETVDHTVTTKKSDLGEVEKYRDFIKKTTGYEPTVSDIYNQAVTFFIARDTVYKKHVEAGGSHASKAAKKPASSARSTPLLSDSD